MTRAGAVVLPAMPGWYHRPRRLEDLVDFVVGRVCDQFGIHNAPIAAMGKPTHPESRRYPARPMTISEELPNVDGTLRPCWRFV